MNQTPSIVNLSFFNRLRTSLIIFVFLLVIVPLAVVIAVVLPRTYSQDVDRVVGQLNAVADLKIQQINQWLNSGVEGISAIIADESRYAQIQTSLRDDSPATLARINQVLSAQRSATNTFDNLIIYDTDGRIRASSNPVDIGKRIINYPYFNGSLANETYIQSPYYATDTNQLAMFVSRQIWDEDGNVLGVLGGTLRIETLTRIMLEFGTGFPESGETYLVSQQTNYFLTPSRFEGYTQTQAYTSEGIELALAGENGAGLFNDYRTPSTPVVGVYRWLPDLQAALIVEVNQSEALASTFDAIQTISIIAVLAGLVAIIIGYFYADNLARPIINLTRAAVAVTNGDYSPRVQTNHRNEIGQLAGAFNAMTAELEHNIKSLETLNADLENRVEERTRDLNIAAQVSQQVSRVLDMKQLLPYLADLTQTGFNLSHVSVFVYDRSTDLIKLQAGSGKVGREMLEAGKQFTLNDKGLVPLAARMAEAQILNDVMQSPDHFVNPLLPNTRSEMAVPMRVGTELIGVLDLQSNDVNHFTDAQVNVLISLADQIAVAVRNADLFMSAANARAEAEKANIVKSQFLAAMSHELRTPLNAVLNFTQFVSSGMLGEVNADQVDMLNKVVQSGKHLLSLINDVLDISKIEAGALKLFIEEDVQMVKEADAVVATAQTLLHGKSVTVETDFDQNLPMVAGDKRRIRQIMLNLVSNACKFTDEGAIHISLQRKDNDILFAVKDTGPGIEEEDFELIFETFRQTNTGLRQGEGTGLGLPISRRLAETHGGRLWLESTVGVGSTFYFTIPINNPELTLLAKRKEAHDA